MGSGIAQKMATEGFDVVLVDVDNAKIARGVAAIEKSLAEGRVRGLFTPDRAAAILARVRGAASLDALADADLVVEAVFEDLDVKRDVFGRLGEACRPDAILATNTSSYSVGDLAAAAAHPERVIGLHYFYHPAKNRLVEVVAGRATEREALARAWALQELLGKTPIASRDSSGFIVNRFFSPWLNEAVRIVEEGVANPATVDAAAKQAFGIGMGPFELMNATGLPIALHTATTLGRAFGPAYEAPPLLRRQVESGRPWEPSGASDPVRNDRVVDRLIGVVFFVASALVEERVGTTEDTDIGARVGLRWRRGPFELMNQFGVARAGALAADFGARWSLAVPPLLARQAKVGAPFEFTLVRSAIADGLATLTINRPDAMNALDETVVGQLAEAFRTAAGDPRVRGIVIAGAGKAFVAGADIRFFLRHMKAGDIGPIEAFTRTTQALLLAISTSAKPVVARLHGLALGGGVELALACHAIVATPRAALGFPETGIGIYPGLGGTQRTTRRVGRGLAKWLVLAGETIRAEDALAIGLVDRVVPHEELDAAIAAIIAGGRPAPRAPQPVPEKYRKLSQFFERENVDGILAGRADGSAHGALQDAVRRVRSRAPVALRLASDLIDRGAALPLEDALRLELDHLAEIFATRDAYEGLSSLGRATPPQFEGR
jgi:enoyl-CoA hydratase/3-hydroxyacyl-CoA dehydrogenase